MDQQEPKSLSRRDLIRAGAALGTASLLEAATAKSSSAEPYSGIYTSGSVIDDPAVRIHVDGWRVTYNPYGRPGIRRETTLRLINKLPYASRETRDATGTPVSYFLPLVNGEEPTVSLLVQERVSPGVRLTRSYLVEPKIYALNRFSNGENYTRVNSEAALSEAELQAVHEQSVLFDAFNPSPDRRVYILNGGGNDIFPAFKDAGDRICLESAMWKNPRFPKEALVKHFLGEAKALQIASEDLQTPIQSLLYEAQIQLAKVHQKVFTFAALATGLRGEPTSHPIFELFSEATHSGYTGPFSPETQAIFYGPARNTKYFNSNALTTWRYFPDEFIEGFKSLDQNEKEHVRNLTFGVLGVLSQQQGRVPGPSFDDGLALLPRLFDIVNTILEGRDIEQVGLNSVLDKDWIDYYQGNYQPYV